MKCQLLLSLPSLLLAATLARTAELTPGSLEVHWDGGAKTCPSSQLKDPIQTHRYNGQTFILREKLCATWEAPFMYLLVGSKQALLIDTGDIADPAVMPLKSLVTSLLAGKAGAKMPLIVVHSHGHLDHRAADPQFDHQDGVTLVLSDLPHVREYFHFADWPNGNAQIDLGGRVVDVLPAPGHHPAQLVFYDRNTGLVFSGDFLLPGRLLVDNLKEYEASSKRVANFLKDRPVSYVLGGHVEKDRHDKLLTWQATDHADEHVLQLSKTDLEALPAAMQVFNGIYTETGTFVIENPIRILIIVAVSALLLLILLGIVIYRIIRRRRGRRTVHEPK